ncbi:MAG: membrane protease YdiL (CAAX protease family) [Candidatus Promineifilaceae bacterium]|jgi:membrane protease YdiL (CAAX protease family)
MEKTIKFIHKYQLILFFLFTFIIAWSFQLPGAFAALGFGLGENMRITPPDSPLNLIALWAPGLSALIILLLLQEVDELKMIFRRGFSFRVGWQWWLIAFVIPVLIPVISYLIYLPLEPLYEAIPFAHTIDHVSFDGLPRRIFQGLPIILLFAIPGAIGAELGWRSYFQAHVEERRSLVLAGSITGAIWGLWHLPVWLQHGGLELNVLLLFLATVKIGVFYAWFFQKVDGSLMPFILLYLMTEITGRIVGHVPYIEPAIWVIIVVAIHFFDHEEPLVDEEARQKVRDSIERGREIREKIRVD